MKNTAAKSAVKGAIFSLPDTIELIIGYGEHKMRFVLRMLTLDQEREWLNMDALKADTDGKNPEVSYASLLRKMEDVILEPVQARNEDGAWVDIEVDGENRESAGEKFRTLFEKFTPANERLVTQLFLEYRSAMIPSKSFL